MNNERKEAIANRFVERPLLLMLVRGLLFSIWFRFFFVACLLLPFAAAALLPKVWRATPPGFEPVIHVSGLDYLQAWSLQRSGRQLFAAGRIEPAVLAWRSALANNPADRELLRGFLREVNQRVEAPAFQTEVLPLALWMLRLSATNLVDLELASTTLVKYGLSHHVLGLLGPHRNRFTAGLTSVYLKALFSEDRFTEFEAYWDSLPHAEEARSDPELQLYRHAFEAGWRESAESTRGHQALERLLEQPQQRVMASRLYLRVCAQQRQVARYFEVLDRLQSWQRDTVRDHIQGWRLLAADRQKGAGRLLASSFGTTRQMSAQDTLLLAQACYDLGLKDQALKTLDRFTLEFGFFDELWVTYGNLLVLGKEWDKLKQLALIMRANEHVQLRLRALAYYLEGRAELAQGHQAAADDAFARIPGTPIQNLGLAFALARNLQRFGYPVLARDTLLPHESAAASEFDFWQLLSRLAYELRDADLIVKATRKALELAPNNLEVMQNYAAALLVTRQQPAEAMKCAFELLGHAPQRAAARLNYAAALIQNRRLEEAQRELQRLADADFSEAERAHYDYARCELLAAQGRKEEARAIFRQLKPEHFFPAVLPYLSSLLEDQLPTKG